MTVTIPGENKSATFYWCHGRMLPPEELQYKEKYSPLLYKYEKNVRDPADYTEDEKQRLKEFSSSENRLNGPGTPMFFFDFLYDSYTQAEYKRKDTLHGNSSFVSRQSVDDVVPFSVKLGLQSGSALSGLQS